MAEEFNDLISVLCRTFYCPFPDFQSAEKDAFHHKSCLTTRSTGLPHWERLLSSRGCPGVETQQREVETLSCWKQKHEQTHPTAAGGAENLHESDQSDLKDFQLSFIYVFLYLNFGTLSRLYCVSVIFIFHISVESLSDDVRITNSCFTLTAHDSKDPLMKTLWPAGGNEERLVSFPWDKRQDCLSRGRDCDCLQHHMMIDGCLENISLFLLKITLRSFLNKFHNRFINHQLYWQSVQIHSDRHTHRTVETGSPVLSDSPAVTRLVPLLEEDFWREGWGGSETERKGLPFIFLALAPPSRG